MVHFVATIMDLFREIASEDIEKIINLCSERTYRRGTSIFKTGDPGNALFTVKEGMVKLIAHSDRGTQTILHLLAPGAIFGEILLSRKRRAFTAVAKTDTVVVALSKENLVRLLAEIPAFSMNFIRVLSRHVAAAEKEFANYGHTWSYHRLAMVLLHLAEEYGTKTSEGTILVLPITHGEVANLIGTRRETVSNQLSRFQRMGLIRREGKALILNVPLLEKFSREAISSDGIAEAA
jgi:CRP/FNR family transcriptional regulator